MLNYIGKYFHSYHNRALNILDVLPLSFAHMSNCFGQIFRISTWGESHGGGVGVVIDGCPPRIPLSEKDIQHDLDRRRPGQSEIVTPRNESDSCEILSGVFEGQTLGSPIAILVRNNDQRPSSYNEMKDKYRPSHADYTYDAKYGTRAWHGGGRASARETIGRVAAAAVAKKILAELYPELEIIAWVQSVKDIEANVNSATLSKQVIESNIVRTADPNAVEPMTSLIKKMRSEGNSIGGVVQCVVRQPPVGLGSPVFGKLEATLAQAMLSLPATKGFEIGSGFAGTQLTGAEHNDAFHMENDKVRTTTNRSGGIQGGISNGENIEFKVAFKPTATIMTEQKTIDNNHQDTELKGRGRHDPCVLPRAVPIVEAMTTLTLLDHALQHRAQCGI
jgi:chorismate synthase